MSTVIRAKISEENPYYISKHRFYELKHHCLQYNDWKSQMARTRTKMASKPFYGISHTSYQNSDLVGNTAVIRASASKSMHEIESIATEAGGDIAEWIFLAVTQGKSYTILQAYGIPCSKEYFYKHYRKFFYLLSQNRE